jgi:hypothetical protein
MEIVKGGVTIRSVEDWFIAAPPAKGARQWVDKRSAKELARAWFPVAGVPSVPSELDSLLRSSSPMGAIRLDTAEPEALVYFDDLRGKPRHCDLVIHGKCALGPLTISVEAKADEPFGRLVSAELDICAKGERSDRSHVPERVKRLAAALCGASSDTFNACRYQLLYGVAAALSAAQARGGVAVFAVHEFLSDATDDIKVRQNQADLEAFLRLLSRGAIDTLPSARLVGPFTIPGNKHVPTGIPLFIGKAIRHL